MKTILPAERSVQIKNGSNTKLLTQKQFAVRKVPVNEPKLPDHVQGRPKIVQSRKSASVIRVCKHVVVRVGHKAWILCTTGVMGTCIIEPNVEQFRKHCLSAPNGTIDVEANVTFHILVANFRLSDMLLPKGSGPCECRSYERTSHKRSKPDSRRCCWDQP